MNRRDAIKRTTFILGAGLSASTIAGIMAGCQPEATAEGEVWTPEFFTPEEGNLIAEIVERIIPATDTPGAKDAGLPAFIDKMYAGYYKPEEQKAFKAGLKAIEDAAQAAHSQSFVALDDAQKDALLTVFDKAAYDDTPKEDTPFFRQLKGLTLSGFFLSEVGATEVLHYEHVPGEYNGCVDYSTIGKTWAV